MERIRYCNKMRLKEVMRLTLAALVGAVIAWYAAVATSKNREKLYETVGGSGKFFDDFAGSYDALNRVISLGFDTSWRQAAVDEMLSRSPEHVLDVATGTGDIVAIALNHRNAPLSITGMDPSVGMIRKARNKIEDRRASFRYAHAEDMPFDNDQFDSVIVSFGVRNFQQRAKGLNEMVRVLKPEGRLVVLEVSSSDESDRLLGVAKNAFVQYVMPGVASILSGHPWAYSYLAKSMESFPTVDQFSTMLRVAGCVDVTHKRLWPFGVGPDLYTCRKMSQDR